MNRRAVGFSLLILVWWFYILAETVPPYETVQIFLIGCGGILTFAVSMGLIFWRPPR